MDDKLLQQLQSDDIFSQFLDASFDVKGYANRAIQGQAIAEQLSKLAEGIALLDREIHSQIVAHHDDLLSQASGVETLEGVLQMMQTRIQSLLAAMDRVRTKVSEPFNKIAARTAQLRNLQETCDLLRRIIRIMYLSKRLHSQLQGGAREITKAAQSLNELDYICEGVDFAGIEIIEQDRRFIRGARKDVETQAQKMLDQGLETQNPTQVATALQVFHNLRCLHQTVDKVVTGCKKGLHKNIRSCLDMQALSQQQSSVIGSKGGPGKASMPVTGNTAAFRALLWTNMEKMMDNIYASCVQVQHLQKVLVKKRDPVTHVCFIEELAKYHEGNLNIMQDFWDSITRMLTTEFTEASEGSMFLKQAFEGEYPKLLRLYNDLWRRLQQFCLNTSSHMADHLTNEEGGEEDLFLQVNRRDKYDPETTLRLTLAKFEMAYLSKSLSRLFDPINLIFSNSSSMNPPTASEVESVVKTIISELNVASVDNKLCVTVSKNVAKTMELFCNKSEQLLATDGEASQVIALPSQGQSRNCATVNTLYLLHQSISKILAGLTTYPTEATESIKKALEVTVGLMSAAVNPLLSSISDAVEAIILTIHQEDFSGMMDVDHQKEAHCSLYMRELQDFVTRCQTDYLSPFDCQDFIMESIKPIASRCVMLFVRHACLVRPLGEGGKMRLAADFAQMELAISPFCKRVSDIGKDYRLLRAFRPLLFQTPEHISRSPTLGDIIPYSTCLHFLFAKGAPPELRSPHVVVDWSISRYSQWLDSHPSEKDRLTLIKGSLEGYVQHVKSRQGKEFTPIYPIMLELLQKGLQIAT